MELYIENRKRQREKGFSQVIDEIEVRVLDKCVIHNRWERGKVLQEGMQSKANGGS